MYRVPMTTKITIVASCGGKVCRRHPQLITARRDADGSRMGDHTTRRRCPYLHTFPRVYPLQLTVTIIKPKKSPTYGI